MTWNRGSSGSSRFDFFRAMALSCIALVEILGRSASARIASTCVVLIWYVMARPANFWLVSSFSIGDEETQKSQAAAAYSTEVLSVAT